jgi:type IV pilus assembly protein PilM
VDAKPNSRTSDLTLIIPDGAVRVLLLDFDALPQKLSEALSIIRFRLKKLVPFEVDDAMVSFQILTSSRAGVRVLAATMPHDILREYETAVREAGFEPGAVLPSTLAALSAISGLQPVLLANATRSSVTTAIVRDGNLLLHRTVDLQPAASGSDARVHPGLVQDLPVSRHYDGTDPIGRPILEDGGTESTSSILVAPTSLRTLTEPEMLARLPELAQAALHTFPGGGAPNSPSEEIAQAISVAAAYFEDTLSTPPAAVLSAGTLGADGLRDILLRTGVSDVDGLEVRELVDTSALPSSAVSWSVPRSSIAGVVGALRG